MLIGRTRDSVADITPINFKEGAYIGPMFVYMLNGAFDAIF